MSSSKEEFHQVMETNVDDAEIPPPNTSRNQIAMMYLASERRNKELEGQLEKANETNEKMQRTAAAFKSKKQVVQNAIGDILQSFNAVLTNHTEKRKVFSNRQLHIIFRDVENKVDPTVSALIKASPPTAEILKKLMEKPERKPKGTMLCRICQEPLKGHGLCPYTTFTIEENENGPCCSLEYFNSKYSASWARMSSACKQKIADKIDANNQHLSPPPTPANFTPANLALAELADVETQPTKKARLA